MEDNVRAPFLVAVATATKRGESALSLGELRRRVQRGRLSRRLVEATAAELEQEGFIERVGAPDRRYRLSAKGEKWIAGRFEIAQQGKFSRFAPREGTSDLPLASDDYRREVRRESWLTIGVAVAPLILIVILIVIFR